jgi:hypothetical protein
MTITNKWLCNNVARVQYREWVARQIKTAAADVVTQLMSENRFFWANWLTCRALSGKQRIQYAIFPAEQVLDVFEKKYPADKRPRLEIEAAKKVLERDTSKNRKAAHAAAHSSHSSDPATYATYAAIAAISATAARKAMRTKIINYGLLLLNATLKPASNRCVKKVDKLRGEAKQ